MQLVRYVHRCQYGLALAGDCDPGYYRGPMGNVRPDVCIPCPEGTYQPLRAQLSCFQCPDGMTTAQTASHSRDHCIGEYQQTHCL